MKRLSAVLILLFSISLACKAQSLVVKTDVLYWASATPNLGIEGMVSPRWTIGVKGGYNPWVFTADESVKTKHILISPHARYWFCSAFHGHFIGLDAGYTHFNVSGFPVPAMFWPVSADGIFIDHLKNSRSEGKAFSAGLEYGCSWPISRCWNLEFNIGLGVWYTVYDRYEAVKCGLFSETVSNVAFGPTSLGVSFVYIIK